MKKLIPTLAVLGSAVAFAIYKLKKDEQKQLMELDQDLLEDDGEDTDEIIHLTPKNEGHTEEEVFPRPSSEIEELLSEQEEIKEVPVTTPEEENESVYHEEQLAEALQSLKEQVEEVNTTDDIRQAIEEAIHESQNEEAKEAETDEKEEEAPVLNEEGRAEYYLPEGVWSNFLTGEARQGGRWYREMDTEDEDDYNEEYPHLTNTLVEDINQMTQEAMDSLENDGDVHEHERPVQHMVSFGSMEDLDNFKNKVINKGFVITKGEGDMDLVVLHISSIDKVKLVSNILYLADQAYANNGEYKGWQSKVSY